MSVVPDPGLISFARGVPAPDMFPRAALARAARRAIENHGQVALNYGDPAGFAPLRDWLGERHGVGGDQILVTPGSIMGLGFLTRLLTRGAPRAAVEAPTYDRMLNRLRAMSLQIESIPRDEHGLDLEEARRVLSRGPRPSFLYTMPTFHNPTGLTLTRDQRAQLADMLAELEITVIEDDPYGLLRFDGEPLPRLHALLRERGAGHLAILLSSFSKTVAPGLRVGYAVLPEALVPPFRELALEAYVSPPMLPQAELYEYLRSGDLEPHLKELRERLRARRDAMLAPFDELMPRDAHWTRPEGGYFLWLELPRHLATSQLATSAARAGVAFVAGEGFFAAAGGERGVRLSFSYPPVAEIRRGAAELARLVDR